MENKNSWLIILVVIIAFILLWILYNNTHNISGSENHNVEMFHWNLNGVKNLMK